MANRNPSASEITSQTSPSQSVFSDFRFSVQQRQNRLWCEHCQKPGHMIDQCWKLHGKPADWQPTRSRFQKEAHIPSQDDSSSSFSKKQIEEPQQILSSMTVNPTNVTYTAIDGNNPYAFSIQWIIDSGALDHMTGNIDLLKEYNKSSLPAFIKIADDSLTTVKGSGSATLNKNLILHNVLYVPRLACNLLSVSKLIKDSGCNVVFGTGGCIFQAQNSKRGESYKEFQCVQTNISLQPILSLPITVSPKPASTVPVPSEGDGNNLNNSDELPFFLPQNSSPCKTPSTTIKNAPNNDLETITPHPKQLSVYSRRRKDVAEEISQPSIRQEPDSDLVASESQEPDSDPVASETEGHDDYQEPTTVDLDDFPIAIRKGVRKCIAHPISKYVAYGKLQPNFRAFTVSINSMKIPRNVTEAFQSPEWKKAVEEKIKALQKNKTWSLTDLPEGKRAVGFRWIFTVKYHSGGSVEIYKARLVAKGFSQSYGIDYQETFAPVVKLNTRILLSVVVNMDWKLHQLDIKNAFLNGNLEEEVYMELKMNLAKEFETKDLGSMRYFLGMEVARSEEGLVINQRKYVLDLFAETGMLDCKPVETPMEQGLKFCKDRTGNPVNKETYQRLVGKLIYLSLTRPDIAYSVSIVSQHMSDPREEHLEAVNRILRFLKFTQGAGLIFRKNQDRTVKVYTDASWGGELTDRRSVSGYCAYVWGNLVTWRSKKQAIVSRSTAESEFRAMALGICEGMWIKRLLTELDLDDKKNFEIFSDSQSAMSIAKNPVQHDRTKHIEIDRHFIYEKVNNGVAQLQYIPTKKQLADIFTKALPRCCDHPYGVDQSLQMLLTKGLQEFEILEVGIKASGKLQLLHAMLREIKKRELKVLILFQFVPVCLAIGASFLLQEAEVANQYIGGSGRDLIGDILDDFLRQRFGVASYERVDNSVVPSKKQSALNRFNNERERFVFLLESRACLPSIKLSAIGTVIIFGSDWNPVNDIRSLQRINLDSQFEQIKVFRLYSSFTVEEKLLILSKQDKTIDNNIENISTSTSHMLINWGAPYLFSQLENFHDISTLDASTLSQQSHLKDVIQEFSSIMLQTGIDDTSKLSLILQAKQIQGTYRTEMPLLGEQKIQVWNEDSAHTFWTKLLMGKCPRWKYSNSTSQRNRKRVQYFDESQEGPQAEGAEVGKRRKKFVGDGNDHPSPKAVLQERKLAAADKEGTSASGSNKINTTFNSIHEANIMSEMPVLKVGEWESRRKQRDSQKNLHVLLRPQIAELCEFLHLTEDVRDTAERFLEYVMNNHLVHREPTTLLQAFQISLCWTAASLWKKKLNHKESLALAKQHLGFTCKKDEADYVYSLLRCLKGMFLYRTGNSKVANSPKSSGLSGKAVERDYSDATSYQQNIKKVKVEDLSSFREGSDIQTVSESTVAPEVQLAQRDLIKSIKEIQKKCNKRMKKQIEKHKQEIEEFNKKYQEEKGVLENKKRTKAAVIRLHSNDSTRTGKLMNLDTECAMEFDKLERRRDILLKDLEALQVAAITDMLERKNHQVVLVNSWARIELVKSPDEYNLSKADGQVHLMRETVVANSGEGQENLVSAKALSSDEISNGAALNNFDGDVHLGSPETLSSAEGYESLPSLLVPSSEEVPGGTTLNTADSELPLSRPEAICSSEGQGNIMSANCSFEKQIPGEATLNVPDEEIPKSVSEIATSCDGMDTIVCTKSSVSEEQIPDTAACSMPAEEVPLEEPEAAPSEVLEGGNIERVNDGTSPNENDQQNSVLCTMNRESEPQEHPSDPVFRDVDSLTFASSELQARCLANSEMQNASQAAETSPFSGAIDVTCDMSNPDATAVELTEQMQQLRSSESTSNLCSPDLPSVSAIEHQSNEGQTANQSSQDPRQPMVNHIELSNQDVLQPLDSPIDGVIDGLVRQALETRTAPVPFVSNGLPLWIEPAVSSRMPITLYHDPLQIEMERIMKILQLKLECDKEIEEAVAQIRRKYEVKLKEREVEFLLQNKHLDVNYNKVLLNKILAEAFRSKCMDNRASGSAREKQEANSIFLQQLLSSQQMVQPSTASGLPSTGSALSMPTFSSAAVNAQTMSPSLQPNTASGIPSNGPASSMGTVSHAVVNAQTMGPPLHVVDPRALCSGAPTRLPHISTIPSSTGNLQRSTEVRAPAPHLQPFRTSSSISPSSLPLHSLGMSSQQAHNNHPADSVSLRQPNVNPLAHRQASTTGRPGRTQHEIARGLTALPNSRLPSLDVLMGVNNASGANANPPGFLFPNSSRSATRFHRESRAPSSQPNSAQRSGESN
ncbi:putative Kinase family protein / peptidoglycan-binding LysM domain-containing protein [Hibiscus syriacus]|uniref:Kinase family protein / peptidoglycan-binding LysM domain-containing protein n=1 Tax=Hibiscus syriacus TaxID=106335 RepID=A0A6A3CJF8_HIBSY|nr:putative Kinase family protein / peptidoglycan-binding LysM domain-containing protein [Hibiscus syriacus]